MMLIALAGACVAVVLVVLGAGIPRAAGMATGPAGGGPGGGGPGDGGPGGGTRTVHVTAGQVAGIDFQGVPGQLTLVGTQSRQPVLTGQVSGPGRAPAVEARFDRASDVLVVSVQCAPGSPCTENLRLAVPAGTRAAVRQPGGSIVVTGLSGPLSITAANVNVSASGLRSPDLAAVITHGRLTAAFAAPPRQVSLTLVSAQATLRMPADVAYRVIQEVMSGNVDAAIPEAANATRTVTARLESSELELLPS
jgi:hypothetical protein